MKTIKKRKPKLKVGRIVSLVAIVFLLLMLPSMFSKKPSVTISENEKDLMELVTTKLKEKYNLDFEVSKISDSFQENTQVVVVKSKSEPLVSFSVTINSSTKLFSDDYGVSLLEYKASKEISNRLLTNGIDGVAMVEFGNVLNPEYEINPETTVESYIADAGLTDIKVILYAKTPSKDFDKYSEGLVTMVGQVGTLFDVPMTYKIYLFDSKQFSGAAEQMPLTEIRDINPLKFSPKKELFINVSQGVPDMTSFELVMLLGANK